MASSVVLEEEYDETYEPTDEEVAEYAKFLGMDPKEDAHLFWIARESLKAPLPGDWKPCQTDDGNIYYFNFKSGESIWDHPCDEHYRTLYQKEKAKGKPGSTSAASAQRVENKTPNVSAKPTSIAPLSVAKNPDTVVDDFDNDSDDGNHQLDNIKSSNAIKTASTTPNTGKQQQPNSAGNTSVGSARRPSGTLALLGSKLPAVYDDKDEDDEEPVDFGLSDDGSEDKNDAKSTQQSDKGAEKVQETKTTSGNKVESKQPAPTIAPAIAAKPIKDEKENSKGGVKSGTAKQPDLDDFDDDEFDRDIDDLLPEGNSATTTKPPQQLAEPTKLPSKSALTKGGSTGSLENDQGNGLIMSNSKSSLLGRVSFGEPESPTDKNDEHRDSKTKIKADFKPEITSQNRIETIPLNPIVSAPKPGVLAPLIASKLSPLGGLTSFSAMPSPIHTSALDTKSAPQASSSIDPAGTHAKKDETTVTAKASLVSTMSAAPLAKPLSEVSKHATKVSSPSTPQHYQMADSGNKSQRDEGLVVQNEINATRLQKAEQEERLRLESQVSELRASYAFKLAEIKKTEEQRYHGSVATIQKETGEKIDQAQRDAKLRIEREIERIRRTSMSNIGSSNPGSLHVRTSSFEKNSNSGQSGDNRQKSVDNLGTSTDLDSPSRKKRADFEREFNNMRDQLNREYRVKEEALKAQIEEEHKETLERAAKEMRESVRANTEDALRKLRTTLNAESVAAIDAAKHANSSKSAADVAEAQRKIDDIDEKLKKKQQEMADMEKKLSEAYENAKYTWEQKLSKLEEEMRAREGDLKSKISSFGSSSRLAAREAETDELMRELSAKRHEVERAMAEESDRRRKLEVQLDDLVHRERELRTRSNALEEDHLREEREARNKHEVVLEDISRLEREARGRQKQIQQEIDALEKEKGDAERKRALLKDEMRLLDEQVAHKRQATAEIGPSERELDIRREELMRERLVLSTQESEIKTRKIRVDEERMQVQLIEREISTLHRQLDDERRALEASQAEIAAERRSIAALHASLSTVGVHQRVRNAASKSAIGFTSDANISQDDLYIDRDYGEQDDVRGQKNRRTQNKHVGSRSKGGFAYRSPKKVNHDDDDNVEDDDDRLDDLKNHLNTNRNDEEDEDDRPMHTQDLASMDGSDAESGIGGSALKQLRARIRCEEKELQKAKAFLNSQRRGIGERMSELTSEKNQWGSLRASQDVDADADGSNHASGSNNGNSAPVDTVSLIASTQSRAPRTDSGHIEGLPPTSHNLKHRSGSLDQIEGELNKMLDLLKEHRSSHANTPTSAIKSPSRTEALSVNTRPRRHYEDSIAAATAAAISSAAAATSTIATSAYSSGVLARSPLREATPRRTGPSAANRTRAWDVDHRRSKALVSEHTDWLRQFNIKSMTK